MQEEENILRIFKETRKAIEINDTFKIKQLSDQTNNTASKTHDPDNIAVAVIIYSIGKILESTKYKNYKGWKKFYKNILTYIDLETDALQKNDDKTISEVLKLIREEIDSLSGDLKRYISDVFRKASINKASKIYEHGISLEKTAKLLGITMFELASYAGQKEIADSSIRGMSLKQRVKIAEEIFK